MKTRAILLVLAVLFFGANQAKALIQFKDGGTHNIDYTINDDVWVDYQAPDLQTTFNLFDGGYIPNKLQGYNDSRINMFGGYVSHLNVYNNSQVIMSGGSVRILNMQKNSSAIILNGSVYTLSTYGSSHVTMSGGSFSDLLANDSCWITMSDVLFLEGLVINGNSQLKISSGSFVNMISEDNSQATISGGLFSNGLHVCGNSHVTMSGGSVRILTGNGSGRATMSGGSASYLSAYENSRIEWLGGIVEGELRLKNKGVLTISGFDFAIDGVPVDFGKITSMLGGPFSDEPYRRLTGTLANGDIVDNQFKIGEQAFISLVQDVPEPGTIVLLITGLVACGFLLRRK